MISLDSITHVLCRFGLHNSELVYDTGVTQYYRCRRGHCGRRWVRQATRGHQPVRKDWQRDTDYRDCGAEQSPKASTDTPRESGWALLADTPVPERPGIEHPENENKDEDDEPPGLEMVTGLS